MSEGETDASIITDRLLAHADDAFEACTARFADNARRGQARMTS